MRSLTVTARCSGFDELNSVACKGQWGVRNTFASAPGPAPAGLLENLAAPGLSATRGVTLAGQSFAAETSTGKLEGPRQVLQVTPAEGQYLINLAPASVSTLTLNRSSGA